MKQQRKKKTIEIRPDGSKLITIEYEPSEPAKAAPVFPMPVQFPMPGGNVVLPTIWKTVSDPPCAFDNLPPGFYGLVCSCPKCSPSYRAGGGVSVTSSGTGTATGSQLKGFAS